MAFNQQQPQGQPQPPGDSPSGLDSITLGQLRAMVGSAPKPKQSVYDFRYDDEDTVMSEIDEFYSYIEMPQVSENLKAWTGSFEGEWIKTPLAQRKSHIQVLLEGLEHRDTEIRFTNARRLFYLLQGSFAETTSPEHQLHWVFENCKMLRSANGICIVIEALKIASSKHDLLCGLSDAEAERFHISAADKSDLLEEVITEISVYLGMLYHITEVLKGHDGFADELMTLDPPLPVYLFNVVSSLKEKTAKGYPIKKLLLVLWKTLLACCGGIRELGRAKKLAREIAKLDAAPEQDMPIKSSPADIETFRQETTVKYPTYTPPPVPSGAEPPSNMTLKQTSSLVTSRLSQAYSPIPIRHHYHHDDMDHSSGLPHQQGPSPLFHPAQQGPNGQYRPNPQSATPAPTPPPSPKPKKQQYQTDQNRPFLLPFSGGSDRFSKGTKTVPFAIDEADKLYNKHMYISLALTQMWRTREDCMTAESGLESMPGAEPDFTSSTAGHPNNDDNDEETVEPLADVAILVSHIAEVDEQLKKASTPGEQRKLKERREDLMRLKRIEQIYSSVLPVLANWVLVMLKLLLATVSATSATQPPPSGTASAFPPGVSSPTEQPPAPPPTLDETDVIRHREINSKAVSAILLLVLKWFKVSHVMKFHHLGQLLLDTNCLLLILKMFGLQEVSISIQSKAESPENNFFRYCQTHFSRDPQAQRPEDNMGRPPRQTIIKKNTLPNGQTHNEEVELLTDFSWRNFFATINFAKVMQKLSKERSHRIWMLVQYKSSAVLKRVLKVNHPMLQLHILKLLKSQVPFCNMKVITSIYLSCRPDLRDEWLTGTEVEDVPDAQAQEQALRHVVKFYNSKRYSHPHATHQHGGSSMAHRHSMSVNHPLQLEGLQTGPELIIRPPVGTPNIMEDVFPPSRSQVHSDSKIFVPYLTEDIAFEEEYEEYLSEVGDTDYQRLVMDDQGSGSGRIRDENAWDRLPAYGTHISDAISDSESIASIGDLADADPALDENRNNWEHMSPKTMAALPKSPAGNRRSSGNGLRPVLPFGLDDGSAVDEDLGEELEPGPAPREQTTEPFSSGAGVDEVEYAYGV